MNNQEIYREKALACVLEAAKVRDPSEVIAMLEIAHRYLILAKHVEKLPKRTEAVRGTLASVG